MKGTLKILHNEPLEKIKVGNVLIIFKEKKEDEHTIRKINK